MSKNIRIIPRLDIKGPNLVKGIHLEGLRVLGAPENFASYYYETGADELIYMDVVASLYGRNSLLDMINKTAKKIFIPLTVGGGIRSLDDIQAVLHAGADKVAINTAAIDNPSFIKKAAQKFGSSTITVSIEAIKVDDNRYEAFTNNGREETGVEVFEWAKKIESLGAGEIFLTSVDQEGTGLGFDIELVNMISSAVNIPVIACGGAGNKKHLQKVIQLGKADAVSIASILHYNFIKKNVTVKKKVNEGNFEFIKRNNFKLTNIEENTISDIKQYLIKHEINCRL